MSKEDGEVIGADSIAKILETISAKHATNIMRATIQGLAVNVLKEIKSEVPVDKGNLRRAFKAKRKRARYGKPVSEIDAGELSHIARFIEDGTVKMRANRFVTRAVSTFESDLENTVSKMFTEKFVQAVEREKRKNMKAL